MINQEKYNAAVKNYTEGFALKAKHLCSEILQEQHDHADTLHLLAVIANDMHDHEKAFELIQKTIFLNSCTPQYYNTLGLIYADMGKHNDAICAYKTAIDIYPGFAQAHFNMGKAYSWMNMIEPSIQCYQQALKIKPDYFKAYNNLGNVFMTKGKHGEAIKCYAKAIKLKPESISSLNNMGNALKASGNYGGAEIILKRSLTINPESAETHCNLGNVLKEQAMFTCAVKYYEKAIQIKPDFAEAHFNLSLVFLLLGKFEKGWKAYEWRTCLQNWKNKFHTYNARKWDGSCFKGKRLLIHTEQGLGDAIQFARYLPMVKARGGTVILETKKPLFSLFRQIDDIDELVEFSSDKKQSIEYDDYIPLMSLPKIFQTTADTIPCKVPYFLPEPDKKTYWGRKISKEKLSIGLVWAGKSTFGDDKHRSIAFNQFKKLFQIPGINIYGLQKNAPAMQAIEGHSQGADPFINLGDNFSDFSDTAGVIDHLDIIISVDTSVAHLSGAMGKKVWVLLPHICDWRWMEKGSQSLWYPTMKLYRQKKPGNWDDVIDQLVEDLITFVHTMAETYISEGLKYQSNGEFVEAEAFYTKAATIKPDSENALFMLGNLYKDSGDFDTAIYYYQKVLDINPDLYEPYFNMAIAFYASNQIEKAIECYKSALVLKPDFPEAYYNLGIALEGINRLDDAIDAYTMAVELKPAFYQAHYNMGKALYKNGQIASSIAAYRKAVALKTDFYTAYNNMGKALHDVNQYDEAIYAFTCAINIKPDYVKAYHNLGNIYLDLNDFNQTIAWYKKALTYTPTDALAHVDIGKMFLQQGCLDESICFFSKAVKLNPEDADSHLNLSVAMLLSGNFTKGWQEYEWRFKTNTPATIYPHRFNQPRWDGAPFKGKTLFIHSEQGLGDTIQFVRFIPMVKQLGGTILFETLKPLSGLLKNYPGIDAVFDMSYNEKTRQEFDFYIPLLSVPKIMGINLNTIPCNVPYLQADPGKALISKKQIKGSGFKVGIVWAGSTSHIKDRDRSITPDLFHSLSKINNIDLIGLQKEITCSPSDLKASGIKNIGETFTDFADTAAAIDNLDLIISVDTSVAHLAGAMGKPVWLLLPYIPDWRWMLKRDDSPWYPTMRLFRQGKNKSWPDVLSKVATALKQRVKS